MHTDGPHGQTLSLREYGCAAWAMMRHPRAFYKHLAIEGGYTVPILYRLGWEAVAAVIAVAVSFLRPETMPRSLAFKLGWIVVSPALSLALGFVLAGILFVVWHLMGSTKNYETAFRCWAYLAPLSVIGAILSLVPYLPNAITLWAFFLVIVASIELQGLSRSASWLLWSVLCVLVFMAQILMAAASLIGGRMRNSQNAPIPSFSSESVSPMAPS